VLVVVTTTLRNSHTQVNRNSNGT